MKDKNNRPTVYVCVRKCWLFVQFIDIENPREGKERKMRAQQKQN